MKVRIARFAVPAAGHGGEHPQAFQPDGQFVYQISDLPPFGGDVSRGNSLNNLDVAAGYSFVTGNAVRHVAVWVNDSAFDLGTLGDPNTTNSTVAWPVKNNSGLIAGIAQMDEPDPLHEDWSCSAFFSGPYATGKKCVGVVWESGVIRPLPTLGGYNGFATGANNRRQIVGWAENTIDDPVTCVPPQIRQFRAVIWGPGRDDIQELPLWPGDNSSAATAINDRGQVVGISGTCDQAVGRYTARHAVLWDDLGITLIGDLSGVLGGATFNTPMAINQRGDVVGFAGLPGFNPLDPPNGAFLWTREGGVQRLHALNGHTTALAVGINERRQIVGTSCVAPNVGCRAVLWENGLVTDLNELRAPGYTNILLSAQDINDRGHITGRAQIPGTSTRPAFLAIPRPKQAE